ncbi:MAG: hypothetical protein PHV59_07575 [Victivallales bacterium]|nr:hypothetical protein [Victivallales bacterium]
MRRLLMLAVMSVFVAAFSGCSSVPKNPNLSGKWSYLYGQKEVDRTGTLELMQSGNELNGVANDAEGQFDVKGTIIGPTLTLRGKHQKGERTFIINAAMRNEDEFEGTYTNNVGEAGKIKGKRE